jgi:hypothetical protein
VAEDGFENVLARVQDRPRRGRCRAGGFRHRVRMPFRWSRE